MSYEQLQTVCESVPENWLSESILGFFFLSLFEDWKKKKKKKKKKAEAEAAGLKRERERERERESCRMSTTTTTSANSLMQGLPTSSGASGSGFASQHAKPLPFHKNRSSTKGQYRSYAFLPTYLRRIVKYKQMDFEYSFWLMLQLCVSPKTAYRHTTYHKQTKNRWSRDDPAFVVICSLFMAVSASAYCIRYNLSPTPHTSHHQHNNNYHHFLLNLLHFCL